MKLDDKDVELWDNDLLSPEFGIEVIEYGSATLRKTVKAIHALDEVAYVLFDDDSLIALSIIHDDGSCYLEVDKRPYANAYDFVQLGLLSLDIYEEMMDAHNKRVKSFHKEQEYETYLRLKEKYDGVG